MTVDVAGEKRWTAILPPLLGVLAAEAATRPTSEAEYAVDAGWVWRILPDAVVIGMRTVGKEAAGRLYRYELRIVAETHPDWAGRLGEIIRDLGLRIGTGKPCPYLGALWAVLPPAARDEGKLAARFVMLAPGETEPPSRRTD